MNNMIQGLLSQLFVNKAGGGQLSQTGQQGLLGNQGVDLSKLFMNNPTQQQQQMAPMLPSSPAPVITPFNVQEPSGMDSIARLTRYLTNRS